MLLNILLMVPVSPVLAESQEQTVGRPKGDQIAAIGLAGIESNDKTWKAYTTLMNSTLAHDTFENYTSRGFVVETENSGVISTANGTLVFVPAVLKADPNVEETTVFGVIGGQVGIAEAQPKTSGDPWYITCYTICLVQVLWWCAYSVKICVNWCLVICGAIAGLAGAACLAACVLAFAPAAPFCSAICAGAAAGVCVPTCEGG